MKLYRLIVMLLIGTVIVTSFISLSFAQEEEVYIEEEAQMCFGQQGEAAQEKCVSQAYKQAATENCHPRDAACLSEYEEKGILVNCNYVYKGDNDDVIRTCNLNEVKVLKREIHLSMKNIMNLLKGSDRSLSLMNGLAAEEFKKTIEDSVSSAESICSVVGIHPPVMGMNGDSFAATCMSNHLKFLSEYLGYITGGLANASYIDEAVDEAKKQK